MAKAYKNQQQSKLLTSDKSNAYTLVKEALESRYISEDTAHILNKISTEHCKKPIKENPDFIKPLVKFLKIPASEDARKNIIDALKSLKNESTDYAWKVEQIAQASGIIFEEEDNVH